VDPNAILELIRAAVESVQNDDGGELELADLIKDLDEWLSNGGFVGNYPDTAARLLRALRGD